METTHLYRVEHPNNGRGPYTTSRMRSNRRKALALRLHFAHSTDRWPSPLEDPALGGIDEDELCGFATLSNLMDWFEDFISDLDAVGYRIAVYIVDGPVRVGDYGQAIFPAHAATRIRTVALRRIDPDLPVLPAR